MEEHQVAKEIAYLDEELDRIHAKLLDLTDDCDCVKQVLRNEIQKLRARQAQLVNHQKSWLLNLDVDAVYAQTERLLRSVESETEARRRYMEVRDAGWLLHLL